jgi:hypothetical protein
MGARRKKRVRAASVLTFEQWRERAAAYAESELGLADCFADDDPYDLKMVAAEAFAAKTPPKAFIQDAFAEDFARRAGDDADFEASLAAEEFDE